MVVSWLVLAAALVALFLVARRLHEARARLGRHESRLASVLERHGIGFSLWSPEGRLVASNQRFREFYPDVPVRPGLELEDLIRYTATRGLVQLPDNGVDAWVAERLRATHQRQREVVRTASGRWLALDIGPTDSGETLMLYTDVTEQQDAMATAVDGDARLQARSADLSLVTDVASAVRRSSGFADAAADAVRLVLAWTHWSVGRACPVDPGASRVSLLPGTIHATDGTRFDPLVTAWREACAGEPDGLVARVVRSKKLVWVASVQTDPTFSSEGRALLSGVAGACGVPVMRDGQVVAVLEFLSAEPLTPSPSRASLLEAVGMLLGSVSGSSV